MARIIATDIYRLLLEQYQRTAYELKKHRSWNNGQIAELLGVSERFVKRMLRDYSNRTGIRHPYDKFHTGDFMDISELVRVKKDPDKGSSQPQSFD